MEFIFQAKKSHLISYNNENRKTILWTHQKIVHVYLDIKKKYTIEIASKCVHIYWISPDKESKIKRKTENFPHFIKIPVLATNKLCDSQDESNLSYVILSVLLWTLCAIRLICQFLFEKHLGSLCLLFDKSNFWLRLVCRSRYWFLLFMLR